MPSRRILTFLCAYAAFAAAFYAYDACADNSFAALPEAFGCHCWAIAVVGFVGGALATALAALLGWLLRPLVDDLVHELLTIRPRLADVAAGFNRLRRAFALVRLPAPLARRCAGRAPPLAV